MNEGEKKVYKAGDRVTFRLSKKKQIDDVLEFINASSNMNEDIINAIKFFIKYKDNYMFIEAIKNLADNGLVKDILVDTSKENENSITKDESKVVHISQYKSEEDESALDEVFGEGEGKSKANPLMKAMKSIRR